MIASHHEHNILDLCNLMEKNIYWLLDATSDERKHLKANDIGVKETFVPSRC